MRILVGLLAAGYGAFRLVQHLQSGNERESAKVWGNVFLIVAGDVLVGAEVALLVMD